MSTIFKSSEMAGYTRTNGSFEEVFMGEYDLPLKNEPKTVLDIGGNEGAFTAWALQKWPNCKIEAFEPVPENADLFVKNHAQNPRVKFHALAVYPQSFIRMYRGLNDSGECSAFNLGEQNLSDSVEVGCIEPSEIGCAEFVKVDTEGCELMILSDLDLSQTKVVVCEYHSELDRETISNLLESKGFKPVLSSKRCDNRGILKFAREGVLRAAASDTNGEIFSSGKIPFARCKRSVFMATTALWSIDPHFFQCCLKAQQELLVKSATGNALISGRFPELYAGESPVGRSRNALVAQFLASDCTDILFIDSDLIFSAHQIERIVLHEEDVVGGCYMLKAQGTPRICSNPKSGVTTPNENGLMEVAYVGTGFLRIRRHVFEKMIEKFGEEMWYRTDDGKNQLQHDFFQMGIYKYADGARRWLSEDWYFCQRCQDMGTKVYCDMNILLGHSGSAVYPLDTQVDFLYPKKVSTNSETKMVATADGSAVPLAEPSVNRLEGMEVAR